MLLSYYCCYEEEEGADLLKLLMPLMPKRNALLMTKNDPWMKKSIRKTERIPEMSENHKTERADDNK